MAKKIQLMQRLGAAMDNESLEWLSDNRPDLADALEAEIIDGATPEMVRRFIMGTYQRPEIALRLEQAARALGAGEEG
jgi:hypothetical protein